MFVRSIPFALSSTLALGCLAEAPAPEGSALTELREGPQCVGCTWGPPLLNTHLVNDLAIPSLPLDGSERHGARLLEVSVLAPGGIPITLADLSLSRGVLSGTDGSGTHYQGGEFVGSSWTIQLGEGMDAELVVMTISSFIDDDPRSRYVFSHGPTIATATSANCLVDPATGEASAILFDGLAVDDKTGAMIEEPGSIYFGCVSGAVGKAAMWGYVPWDYGRDMHQAASRVVRADYCGDGQAWTQTGTALQLEDEAKLNEFAAPEQLTEAMWGPDGAVCLRTPRRDEHEYVSVTCDGQPLPKCAELDDLADWPTALMWTKRWDLIGPALW